MTVRVFWLGSLAVALGGVAAWLLVITQLSPGQAGTAGFILFFLSLFVAASSIAALLGYVARRLLLPRQFLPHAVRASVRQGIMVSLFLSLLFFLQLNRLYRWWLAVILVVFCVSFELIFLSYDRASRRQDRPA